MLVGGVIDYQLGNDAYPVAVRFIDESLEMGHGAVGRLYIVIIGNIIAVITEGRGIER